MTLSYRLYLLLQRRCLIRTPRLAIEGVEPIASLPESIRATLPRTQRGERLTHGCWNR